MCGIFAYQGRSDASTIVFQGLRNLQYRGYDSWGIAVLGKSGCHIQKDIGALPREMPKLGASRLALGHTRWATHGGVTRENAHPHTSCDGRFVVVHNGIIENHAELKSGLTGKHRFTSSTDTEIIAHYLECHVPAVGFHAALRGLIAQISGYNAFVILDCQTHQLSAYRTGSPLVLGKNSDGLYVSSDLPSLAPQVDSVYPLGDRELVELSGDLSQLHWLASPKLKSAKTTIKTRYHMESEMYETEALLASQLKADGKRLEELAELVRGADRVILTGCGSAYHACLYGEYLLGQAGLLTKSVIASEGGSSLAVIGSSTVMIVLSQSGETIDTLDYVMQAKEQGACIVALTNVAHSSLDRAADLSFPLGVGVEYAVASTKAFVFMLMFFADLASQLDGANLLPGKQAYQRQLKSLYGPARKKAAEKLAKKIAAYSHLYIISHADLVPLGYEAALKFKEIGYLHAENIVSGEIKHGPLALVTDDTLCLVLSRDNSHDLDHTVSEITARGGKVIQIRLPDIGILTPLYGANLLHLLSFTHAVLLGHNPDQPRNLAKSVTVR